MYKLKKCEEVSKYSKLFEYNTYQKCYSPETPHSLCQKQLPKNFAYFQSIIRYGPSIWGNCSKVDGILIVQKKAVRIVTKSEILNRKPLFIEI